MVMGYNLNNIVHAEKNYGKEYEGYIALFAAIMEQAFMDLKDKNAYVREQALKFFHSMNSDDIQQKKYFEWMCSILNLEPTAVTERINKFSL